MDVPVSTMVGVAVSYAPTPRPPSTSASARAARFGMALPRRFVLPSLLMLLMEGPNYGFNLQQQLQEFQLGHIDRPTTYRALSQLEADGMVTSWPEPAGKGKTLQAFAITDFGREVLDLWMSTIVHERDCLDQMVHRFQQPHAAGNELPPLTSAQPSTRKPTRMRT
jgi:DNA-binding PadR family transcriptional regulator